MFDLERNALLANLALVARPTTLSVGSVDSAAVVRNWVLEDQGLIYNGVAYNNLITSPRRRV